MDTTLRSHTPMRPKPMAELLPIINAILTKESCKKQPPYSTGVFERNTKIKPMKYAEIMALMEPVSKKPHSTTSTKPKPWNSSIKVDKSKTLIKDGQSTSRTVRKVLNFQSKVPKPPTNAVRAAVARKSVHPQDSGMTRISGVCKIAETPIIKKPKHTFIPHQDAKIKLNNVSTKSNSDDSFVQKEKEINDFEEKSNALTEEPTLEKISEISPPVSTPYRNFRDYFDHSETDNSALWNENTIMSFDKSSDRRDNTCEESVIVSLCEMLTKTTVTNSNNNLGHSDLLEVETVIENNLKVIDNVIEMMNSMKVKQLKSLQHIRKLKCKNFETNEAKENNMVEKKKYNVTVNNANDESDENNVKLLLKKEKKISPEKSPITSRPTVIKSKSPSYKIPRKNLSCLRKKIISKSTPNVSDGLHTPKKINDTALSMYMQIKGRMTFLSTPLTKPRTEVPDTPAITSLNLQKQLDNLYN